MAVGFEANTSYFIASYVSIFERTIWKFRHTRLLESNLVRARLSGQIGRSNRGIERATFQTSLRYINVFIRNDLHDYYQTST